MSGTPLLERALGDEWADLHPEIRERYGLVAADDQSAVGTGKLDLTRNVLALPALYLGTLDDFLFPEDGWAIPFEIRTDAFVDAEGNEGLTLRRSFETEPRRRFVDTLRWNPKRGCITELFGTEGRVVTDLYATVEDGGLRLDLGDQWVRFGGEYFRVPDPLWAEATTRDWYDDHAGRFRVSAAVTTPLIGHVFGYSGAFDTAYEDATDDRLTHRPLRAVDLPRESA